MIYLGNGMYSDSGPQDQLMHYGVLGMRWGVRKAQKELQRYDDWTNTTKQTSARDLRRLGYMDESTYKRMTKQLKKDRKYHKKNNKQYRKKMIERYKANKKLFKDKYPTKDAIYKEVIDTADKITPGYKQRRKEWRLGAGYLTQQKVKWDDRNIQKLNPYRSDGSWKYKDIGGNVGNNIIMNTTSSVKNTPSGEINFVYEFENANVNKKQKYT